MSVSQVRQNFHELSEKALNKQINMELSASYTYMSMAAYFDRDDVALPGFSHMFEENSEEEREHAEKLIKYVNKRGGRVVLQSIDKPSQDEWGSGLDALQAALELEKKVNQSLLDVHKIAQDVNDPHLCDFLESEYLGEQVEAIKKLGDMITQLKRAGPQGLGEYLFDKDIKKSS